MKTSSIFLFAGESSGDDHGAMLIPQLRQKNPLARIYGVGGPKMRDAGLECIMPMENFEVMGFVDVFLHLPKLIYQFFTLRNTLLKDQPDIVLLIDYPGFNLALAKSLFKRSFKGKICQYISPSVWAWGKKRIPKMEKILDQLFVIFPFEKQLFDNNKLSVHYVGHPLTNEISHRKAPPLNISSERRVVGIFPGSREKELFRNFPLQLKVMRKLLTQFPEITFVVSIAKPSFSSIIDRMIRKDEFPAKNRIVLISSSQNPALMKRCDIAIAKSGTNNLELALHGVPTVVTYGISPLDLFIAKNLLRINLPHYSIVNILAGERVFPELIGPHFTEKQLFEYASNFLSSEKERIQCREKCQDIGKLLNNKSPHMEIAEVIKNILIDEKRPV